jgi:hypothetical protein
MDDFFQPIPISNTHLDKDGRQEVCDRNQQQLVPEIDLFASFVRQIHDLEKFCHFLRRCDQQPHLKTGQSEGGKQEPKIPDQHLSVGLALRIDERQDEVLEGRNDEHDRVLPTLRHFLPFSSVGNWLEPVLLVEKVHGTDLDSYASENLQYDGNQVGGSDQRSWWSLHSESIRRTCNAASFIS